MSGIKDPRSANNSYEYQEDITTDLFGSWLCISIIFRKPCVGSGSIFSRKYNVDGMYTKQDCRMLFMSDFLSHLLEQND